MTTSRIDFVCCDVACGDKVLDCRVVDEVDLTMDASVDHRMIMMTMHVDVTRFVREAALRRFGSARPAPMKPWISALTWSFLRLIAPVRRSIHAAFDVAKKLEKQGDFVSERS